MIFVPGAVGIDGFDGGFAISFASILIAVTGVAVGVMFLGSASKLDRLLRGEGVLAHWVYTPQLWVEFTGKEYIEEKSEKKGLFLVIAAFALFFGFLFWILDTEAGFYVFLVMLGLILLCFMAWQLSAWSNLRQNSRSGAKEVYITKDAVYLNSKFITWTGWFSHFNSATLEQRRGMTILVFRYTIYTGRAGPQPYTTRVPVPVGQEQTAQWVMEQINRQN